MLPLNPLGSGRSFQKQKALQRLQMTFGNRGTISWRSLRSNFHGELVGGFNPSKKYESNWISSPGRGKKKLKPPPNEESIRMIDHFLGCKLELVLSRLQSSLVLFWGRMRNDMILDTPSFNEKLHSSGGFDSYIYDIYIYYIYV